jgi:heterotetrameric sarcosine oxidase delta subunit
MRLTCPYCGPRDLREFTYRGDATLQRPDPAAPSAPQDFADYVYLRANPRGPHREHWYHAAGCRSWLVVERDTRSHVIAGVQLARDVH